MSWADARRTNPISGAQQGRTTVPQNKPLPSALRRPAASVVTPLPHHFFSASRNSPLTPNPPTKPSKPPEPLQCTAVRIVPWLFLLSSTSSSLQFSTSIRSLIPSTRSPLTRLCNLRASVVSTPARLKNPKLYLCPRGAFVAAKTCRGRTKASAAGLTREKEMGRKVEVFDSEEELAASLARYTADLAYKCSQERGFFTAVLSGGSLIKSLGKLTEPPYVDSVDWSKWHVFWADERVVPKDHVDSNYKLAFDGFLSKVPVLPVNVYSINDALPADGAADDYAACIRHLVKSNVISSSSSGFPKFDLMLFGMGPDGHVASLFPGHPLLGEKEKWVTSITDSPKPPPERITLTFPVINSCAHIVLVVAGAAKADPVHAALCNDQKSDVFPVQRVTPERELTWFLDKDAASKL